MADIIYQVQGLFTFLIIFAVGIMGYILTARYRNQKKFERDENGDKIWAFFWTAAGKLDPEICNVDQFRVQPPKGHDIAEYFIQNECVYEGTYPLGSGLLHKLTSIKVPATSYIQNRREPIASTDPQRWIESDKRSEITATLQRVAVNESFAKSAQVLQSAAWKDMAGMAQYAKYSQYNLFASLGIIFGIVVLCVMIVSLNNNLSSVLTAFFSSAAPVK